MKNILLLILGLMASGGALASENASLVTLSSKGPDTYADGTAVLDGETYALVWTRTGVSFAGFNLDGTLADPASSAVLYAGAVATNGACPEMTFAIDPEVLSVLGSGGSFALHVLDTRTFRGSKALPGGSVQGSKEVVAVDAASFAKADGDVSTAGVFKPSFVAEQDAPSPKITGIRLEGDEIVLTVENTVQALNYNVAAGETPSKLDGRAAKSPVSGGGTVELRVPKTKGAGFFRVRRN